MPSKAPSAASGRRNGSDGRCASHRPPDEHHHGADHVSLARITSIPGRPESVACRTLRPLSTASSRTSVAPPRCGRGPPARRDRRTRSRPSPRAAPARARRDRRRLSDGRLALSAVYRVPERFGRLERRHCRGRYRHRLAGAWVAPCPRRTVPVNETSRIALLPRAPYSAARKPRGGSGTVPASARRALPLKRRSG